MSSAFHSPELPALSRRRALTTLAAAGLGTLAAGCGVAEYEARMEDTIEDLKLQNQFVLLKPEPTILNGPGEATATVMMRLPYMLLPYRGATPLLLIEGCTMPENQNEPLPVDRLKPPEPLPQIPGFQVSLEQYVPTGAGVRPCYLYVGLEKADKAAAAATRQKLLDEFKTKVGPTEPRAVENVAWQRMSLETPMPGAPKVTIDQLVLECTQLFWVRGNTPSPVAGQLTLMTYEAAGHLVVLGWRIPTSAKEFATFNAVTKAAAGTLTVAPLRAAAATK
jgi:hypothetical protein